MANTYSRTTTASVDLDEWAFDVDGNGSAAPHGGGPATFGVDSAGDIGSGSLRWQWKALGGTKWANLGTADITAVTAGAVHLTVAPGRIRPALSSSTNPDLTVFKV